MEILPYCHKDSKNPCRYPDILEILLITNPETDHSDNDYWNKYQKLAMIIYCVRKVKKISKKSNNFKYPYITCKRI